MAERLNFPFVEKEGKHFAPIVSSEARYAVVDGAVVQQGERIVSGIKGVYAEVRMRLPQAVSGSRSELFAVNSEAVHSSN